MTQPDSGRARLPIWVACVAAGVLLLAAGVVLGLGGHRSATTRHAIAPVNIGTVPSSSAPQPLMSASRHRVLPHHVPTGSLLRLARLGVTAPITRVRVVDNVMQVPLDPRKVGWWTSGAAPGDSRGTTVLVGHVNYGGVGGALSALPSLLPGDVVTIAEPQHSVRYRVAAVRTYAKTAGIPREVFTKAGAPRLVLITCGGPFDSATGNYEDNIVAYAVAL